MTPPHLSGAFNQDGFLAIAIQKTDATIEITHGESQGVASFIGQSPQLINDGILYASDTPGRSQVACIYVRGDRNDMLFARFENENFATEYIIVRATRSNIVKLLSITISALHFTIHGIDYLGRDVKMTSDDYFVELLGEKVSLSTSILSGKLAELGVVVDAGHDASKVTLALKDGTNFLAARVPPTTTDNITLSIGIESGTLT